MAYLTAEQTWIEIEPGYHALVQQTTNGKFTATIGAVGPMGYHYDGVSRGFRGPTAYVQARFGSLESAFDAAVRRWRDL
jgi:hypothetical protein